MFHVNFMDGLEPGTAVRQGQYLGEISGPGGPGFAGTPHLHFTLWASNDNGNWDRQAVPFTGPVRHQRHGFPRQRRREHVPGDGVQSVGTGVGKSVSR